jgi:hypothetical protein
MSPSPPPVSLRKYTVNIDRRKALCFNGRAYCGLRKGQATSPPWKHAWKEPFACREACNPLFGLFNVLFIESEHWALPAAFPDYLLSIHNHHTISFNGHICYPGDSMLALTVNCFHCPERRLNHLQTSTRNRSTHDEHQRKGAKNERMHSYRQPWQ